MVQLKLSDHPTDTGKKQGPESRGQRRSLVPERVVGGPPPRTTNHHGARSGPSTSSSLIESFDSEEVTTPTNISVAVVLVVEEVRHLAERRVFRTSSEGPSLYVKIFHPVPGLMSAEVSGGGDDGTEGPRRRISNQIILLNW